MATILKAPAHQVAGHQAGDGKLGPLMDDLGRFCKPLQDGERGAREVAFYTRLFSIPAIPDHIRNHFPVFHGTKLLEASDGSGLLSHLILDDLLSDRLHPSVMDIKIGSRTWYPEAPEDYVQKCLKKDRESTSLTLGFRISGLKTYISEDSGFWKPDKKSVQKYTTEDVSLVLKRFVSSNPQADSEPDCRISSGVYGGSDGILAQLLKMKEWFEVQTFFHFNSCSVLMVYEQEAGGTGILRPEVKLIDFAHVVDGQGVIDHNFLGGLCSLIKFVSDILAGSTGEDGLNVCEKPSSQNGFI